MSLDENLTYAGTLDDQSGDYGGSYLNLGGDTLSLSGTSALTAGAIYGSGSVLNTGTATIGGNIALGYDPVSGYAAADTFTLENAGSVSQTGNIGLNATILNEAGATYTISAGNISAEASAATFTNDGTFDDDGSAINYVGADFDTNGTLAITSGATLDFEGSASSLDGTVSGTGTLILNGSTALNLGNRRMVMASLTVSTLGTIQNDLGATYTISAGNISAEASAATFTNDLQGGTFILGESLAYAGAFDLQGGYFGGGYLGLGGDTLTLSGASVFSGGYVYGPGSVVNTGTATLDSLNLGNGPTDGDGTDDVATFENAATVVQDGNVELNGTIQNDLGATYTISAGNIGDDGTATFTNSGTLDDASGGMTYIAGTFDNTGTLSIASGTTTQLQDGTQALHGAVIGGGTLDLAGNATLAPATLTVSALTVDYGTTTLGENVSYGGTFATQASLALAGNTLTLTGSATFGGGIVDGPGTVKVVGTGTIGSILLGYDPVSGFAAADASTFENAGSVTQNGNIGLNGTIQNDAGATWTIDAGRIAPDTSAATFTNDGTLDDPASDVGYISVDLVNAGTVTAAGTLVVNGGVTNDGTLAATGGALDVSSAVSADPAATGGITIAAGALAEFDSTVASDQTVTFQAATGTLQIADQSGFAATIAGFQSGDVIDLSGVSLSTGDQTDLLTGNILQITNASQMVITDLQLDATAGYSGQFFHLASDPNTNGIDVTVNTTACYVAGTLILTDRGEVAVETLAIGDIVVTASGARRPIKWMGWRSYSGRLLAGRRDMLPVCFSAGSLGEGLPRRDLFVSPKHAMFLDGVLVPAEHLVNGITVSQARRVESVAYYHIELDSHDVLLAEGAPSESFVDDDNRGMFHNGFEFYALYPEVARLASCYCAPRVEDGYGLERLRRRLAEQAGIEAVA